MKYLFLVASLFLIGCLNLNYNQKKCKQFTSPIAEIGACSQYGYCGVILEDGTIVKNTYQPIVGTLPDGGLCFEQKD